MRALYSHASSHPISSQHKPSKIMAFALLSPLHCRFRGMHRGLRVLHSHVSSHLNTKQAKLWHSLSSPRSTADAVACIEACVCCIAMPSHLISSHLTTKDTIAAFPLPSLPSPQMLSWTLSRPVCTATCRSQREEGRRGARSCNTYSVGPTAEPLGTRSQCFILQHLVVAVDPQSQWMCIVYCHEIHYQAGLHCDSSAAP